MTVSLPEELVSEILTRLPAKSLLRFKSVERTWNTLFKTNSFIRRQREWRMVSSSSSDEDGERFMMFYRSRRVTPHITLVSYNHLQLQHLQYPVTHPDHFLLWVHSLGHCNGIFCLLGTFNANSIDSGIEETILWNPATREVKVLPLTPPAVGFFRYYGFGVSDPGTFDHFFLIQFYHNDTVVYVELYNINSDSWNVIHDIDANGVINPDTDLLRSYGAYSNGVCYWLSSDYTYIVCFDFRCNKFRKIDTPSTMSFSTILEARDCIAYLVYDRYDSEHNVRVEIWNLKQDSSWVKLCNFDPHDSYIRIRAIWKDGTEFLAGSDEDFLTLYNSRAQPLRQLEIFAPEYQFYIYPYMESIAPLSP